MTTKLSAFLVVLLALVALPSRGRPRSRSTGCGTPPSSSTTARSRFRSASSSPARARTSRARSSTATTRRRRPAASLQNGKLSLNFDELGTKLEATLKDGQLEGEYSRGTRGAPYPFHAKRFTPSRPATTNIPSIAGLWNVQVGKSSKGEAAWQLIVRQSGAEVSAVDPAHRRRHRHADRHVPRRQVRAQPLLRRAAAAPRADAGRRRHARRGAEHRQAADRAARRAGRAPRGCRSRAIRRASPASRIRPSRSVSASPISTARSSRTPTRASQGKVVIVTIGGSWCPNCHDETPFLVELYKKYKKQGLEIVELSFEEEAQRRTRCACARSTRRTASSTPC